MNVEFPQTAGRMSVARFRAFQEGRPSHERWELIAGVPMMMTPPTIAHNRIASNLERLLNDALAAYDNTRLATQRPGIALASGEYTAEPDVGVIESDYEPDQRIVERAYLLAEIVSATDEIKVPGSDTPWVDVKRAMYREHPSCEAVLIIEQDRMEVRIDTKAEGGWISKKLGADDNLDLPGFGLHCAVADLYENTPLLPRSTPRRTT